MRLKAFLVILCVAGVWSAARVRGDSDPCAGDPGVGTVCTDGTVYAGVTPDGNRPIYAMPCDLGMIPKKDGDKWTCSGNRETYVWYDGAIDYQSKNESSGVFSATNGKRNTEALVRLGKEAANHYVAAKACANQRFGGYNDWYLPAVRELVEICDGTTAIHTGPTSRVSGKCPQAALIGGLETECREDNCRYWSSSEDGYFPTGGEAMTFATAWTSRFSDGLQGSGGKAERYFIRCVRQKGQEDLDGSKAAGSVL
jgi:hypothetical protein